MDGDSTGDLNSMPQSKQILDFVYLFQCIPCGPGNRGNCFGPNICCGEDLGCYIGTPETLRCVEENYLPSPCEAGGKPCGAGGRCAAPGVCCNDEYDVLVYLRQFATVDSICLDEDSERQQVSSDQNMTQMDGSASDLLRRLMHMANRQQQQTKHY
ncbi:vasotocin-neurophysin VT-like [Rana temporaria]|uniref:vasotocin-neurophysin VT-like n=1 Tax=Rana temporaria TaxID=8407 RepID=UPI001AACCF76|nr:vasotocin-neurophysin VT-like [Rana temporaria]